MRIRPLCFAALALAVTAGSTAVASSAGASTGGERTILEIVDRSVDNNRSGELTDHNWNDFDVLRAAVITLPGLADAVTGLDGATVFAPTDRSFRALVADLTNQSRHSLDEADVLDALLAIAGEANLNGSGVSGVTALSETVLYHVSPTEISNLRNRTAAIPTANSVGATEITPRRALPGVIELRDGDANDSNPFSTGRRINASNGVVYPINGVLRPLDLAALFPGD
jgi:uncharacterized surface protein with fasciclin (FAS1) repeats